MSYRIGSFNVMNLSFAKRTKRNLDLLAEIISEYDIIAFQEVLSEGKLLKDLTGKATGYAEAVENSLKSRLGNDEWDMEWLNPETNSKWYPYIGKDARGEGYAFMWRKKKFSCPIKENGVVVRPRIIHQYKVDQSRGELRLIRDPAYGRFQLVDMPNTEIRLITTHIVFGKPDGEHLSKIIDYGASTMRKNEFNILARSIYTSVSDNRNETQSIVPYTIILGDYNLNLSGSGAGSPCVPSVALISPGKELLEYTTQQLDNGCYVLYTQQEELSTVNGNGDDYKSNYDHFTFDERTLKSIVRGNPHRLDIIEKAGGLKKYKEEVSDHIPIVIELDLKK